MLKLWAEKMKFACNSVEWLTDRISKWEYWAPPAVLAFVVAA